MPARQRGLSGAIFFGLFRDTRRDVHDADDDRPTEAIFVPSCNTIAGAIDIQERRLSRKERAPEYPGVASKYRIYRPNKSPHGLRKPPTTIATVDLFGSKFLRCNCENAAKLIVHKIKHSQQLPFLITHINTHSFRTVSSTLAAPHRTPTFRAASSPRPAGSSRRSANGDAGQFVGLHDPQHTLAIDWRLSGFFYPRDVERFLENLGFHGLAAEQALQLAHPSFELTDTARADDIFVSLHVGPIARPGDNELLGDALTKSEVPRLKRWYKDHCARTIDAAMSSRTGFQVSYM
jgi:hypothetical protein